MDSGRAGPPVTVVTGTEEFLVARAVQRVVAGVRAADPQAQVHEVAATELVPGAFTALTEPSLFGERRVVVVRGIGQLGKDVAAEITAFLQAADAAEVTVVLVHEGGGRGKALLDAARAAAADVVDCPAPRWPEDRVRFVTDEVRTAGGTITAEAAGDLVAAVGTDLRELASAAAQLVSDGGGTVDEDLVARYHRGRAETSGFVVADAVLAGDTAGALQALRWASAEGLSPVAVNGAIAANLRTVAQVMAAGRGSPQALAGELKMPPWKVRKAQGWGRGWRPEGLAAAVRLVAEADAGLKGGAADPLYTLERAIVRLAAAREQR